MRLQPSTERPWSTPKRESQPPFVVQPLIEGGIRALATTLATEANTEDAFPISSESDSIVLALNETGGVDVETIDGAVLAGIEAPWAIDADGVSVPTHHRVEGNTVVQVVEHEGYA